ncbi:hypothetical protein NOSIN_01195 [Nocardiopsis sinuspersici]|uniref:Uncharacterized protein n=2 Tax=Nocardiopsidaceae TaxID=83676 RepID=A0A1V3BW51_9ACTN|nr:hypothetical protein NOSIN_01195 [Nocardiopsis sinuspersici]
MTSGVLSLYGAAMESQPPTGLDIATFVIAVVAVVTAAVSLTWNVLSWLFSGGLAKVELDDGVIHANGTTYALTERGEPVDPSVTKAGFTRRALFVTVRSKGRLPVTVAQWHLKLPKHKYVEMNSLHGPSLPHRLEPGEQAMWAIEVDEQMLSILRDDRAWAKVDDVEVYAVVSLGSGKEIKTPQRITFTANELEQGE